MMFTCLPAEYASAAVTEVNTPSKAYSFSSTTSSSNEYVRGSIQGTVLKISLKTLLPAGEFRVALYGTNPETEVWDLGINVPAVNSGPYYGPSVYGFEYTAMKLSPKRKAWATPSGDGCSMYSRRVPNRLPSPSSCSYLGRSECVERIRISRIPASISVESG